MNLDCALRELEPLSAVSRKANGSYVLAPEISARVLEHLPPEQHSFWKLQALIVAFRSVPWKYLEPKPMDAKQLRVYLRHTLCGVQDNEGFQSLEPDMRMDLVFTLVEASRFPDTAWKWFVISQANEIMRGLNHPCIQPYISQRESLLYRITGNLDRATSVIYNPSAGSSQFPVEVKAHAGAGQVAIQHALNCIQVEQLTKATDILEAWQPTNQEPSPMEEVLLFQKYVILGRISRFQGNFVESLESLERSKNLMYRYQELDFSEDRVDLICNLGDTLIELRRPVDAEHYLRTEISYQDSNNTSAGSLLKLALAESLFAQDRHLEAESICSDVQSQGKLLKMGKLRLTILQAKLSHTRSDWEAAFNHWTEAMRTINQFTLTHGHTTRIILLSICDVFRRQGQHDLELQSRCQLTTLEQLAGNGGTLYWIGGLRHWLGYLQSPNKPHM